MVVVVISGYFFTQRERGREERKIERIEKAVIPVFL